VCWALLRPRRRSVCCGAADPGSSLPQAVPVPQALEGAPSGLNFTPGWSRGEAEAAVFSRNFAFQQVDRLAASSRSCRNTFPQAWPDRLRPARVPRAENDRGWAWPPSGGRADQQGIASGGCFEQLLAAGQSQLTLSTRTPVRETPWARASAMAAVLALVAGVEQWPTDSCAFPGSRPAAESASRRSKLSLIARAVGPGPHRADRQVLRKAASTTVSNLGANRRHRQS